MNYFVFQLQQYYDQFRNETHPFEPFKCRVVKSITDYVCVSYWTEQQTVSSRRKRAVTLELSSFLNNNLVTNIKREAENANSFKALPKEVAIREDDIKTGGERCYCRFKKCNHTPFRLPVVHPVNTKTVSARFPTRFSSTLGAG